MRAPLPSLWDHVGKSSSLGNLRQEIDRLFEDFSRSVRGSAPFAGSGLVPDMDIHDTEKEVILSIELPGVDEKDITVSVSGQSVTISGEKKSKFETKGGDNFRKERRYGEFSRSVTLPFTIDPDKVDARFAKGVLTVTVHKPSEVVQQTRKIPIIS